MTFKEVIKYSLKQIGCDIKDNAKDLGMIFVRPLRRAKSTFKVIGGYMQDYKDTKFYEKHKEDIERIWAPMEEVLKTTKDSYIAHGYAQFGYNNRQWARYVYAEPMEELIADIRKFSDTKKYPGEYAAQLRACQIAFDIRLEQRKKKLGKVA